MSGADKPSELRGILNEVVAEKAGDEKVVALMMSGGVDSTSVGFAANEVGKRVVCYTFQMGELKSADSAASKKIATAMGWEFNLIKVPVDNLEADAIKLAAVFGCKKKTQFECTLPFLYIFPKIKQKVVFSGLGADGHFGLSKKVMIHHRFPRKLFDDYRRDYFSLKNPAGLLQQKKLAKQYGIEHGTPYFDKRVFDFFIRYDWSTLNKPIQKIPILRAYPEKFREVGRRDHANLQLVARVDIICQRLLSGKLNTKHRTRMMDFWRDVGERYGTKKA
jgi:asparagine synthetase B (glutamine-hydrolysing)